MEERFRKIKIASVFGILGNIFLVVIKTSIGILTKSQAMLADAFNSISDVFSSFMTFIGNKIASKPKDEDHNLGHGKAEYIYSMLISIAMFLLAYTSFKSSLMSLIFKNTFLFSKWLVIVCLLTILTKSLLFLYTNKLSKKYKNILLEANAKDHRNDCVITLCNLISCLLALKGWYFFDGIVGLIISLWIFYTAFEIFKESYNVLMDKSIDEETKKKVYEIIEQYKEIKRVNHFNATPVGYRYQISFTIFVDGNLSTFESHTIADKLEDEIEEKVREVYLTVIHVNPIKENESEAYNR